MGPGGARGGQAGDLPTVRYLAGGDVQDLWLIYCVDRSYVYSCIWAVVDAINKGQVYRFVSKPWNEEELRNVIRSGFYLNRSRVQNAEQGTEVLALLDKIAGQVEGLGRTLEQGTPGAVAEVQQALKNMRSEVLQERQRYAQWMNRAGK